MPLAELMDWGTAATLAVLVLVDSLRSVPPEGLILRKAIGRPWARVPASRSRFSLPSWPAPLALTLLVHPPPEPLAGAATPVDTVPLRRLWPVRLLGGATGLALLVGVPLASRWLAAAGFLWSLTAVLTLSASTTVAAVAAAPRRAGARGGIPWWLSILSPFGAPRAADICAERLMRETSQVEVAARLLPAAAFHAWLRPRAFDRLRPGAPPDPELDGRYDGDQLLAVVRSAPHHPDADAFCPRCGTGFRAGAPACGDCDVPLVSAGTGRPREGGNTRGPAPDQDAQNRLTE